MQTLRNGVVSALRTTGKGFEALGRKFEVNAYVETRKTILFVFIFLLFFHNTI